MNSRSILIIVLLLLAIALGYSFLGSKEKTESQMNNDSSMVDEMDSMPEEQMETVEEEVMEGMEGGEDMMDSMVKEDVVDEMSDTAAEVKEFTLDAFNFGYSIEEIKVKKGDTVTINMTNSDGFHDWVLDEFGASTAKIPAGETTSVTFVASETGEYEYYCSVGSHRANGMVGKLIVE